MNLHRETSSIYSDSFELDYILEHLTTERQRQDSDILQALEAEYSHLSQTLIKVKDIWEITYSCMQQVTETLKRLAILQSEARGAIDSEALRWKSSSNTIIASRLSLMALRDLQLTEKDHKQLSHYPFTTEDIVSLKTTWECIRSRFAKALTNRDRHPLGIHPKSDWNNYVSRFANQDHYLEGQLHLKQLSLGYRLEQTTVLEYLGLLRDSKTKYPIAEICTIKQDTDVVEILNSIQTRPRMLPIQHGARWLFAAIYDDTIHWYDSDPGSEALLPIPKTSVPIYAAGPKHSLSRPEDAGLLMLFGLRQVANTFAHTRDPKPELAEDLRAQLLVELLSQRLDPTEHDFEELIFAQRVSARQADEAQSAYFSEAMLGMESPRSSPASLPTFPREAIHSDPNRVAPMQDDRKAILSLLYDAVRVVRSVRIKRTNDICTLWTIVQGSNLKSELHRRYSCALFFRSFQILENLNAETLEHNYGIDKHTFRQMKKDHPKHKIWDDCLRLQEQLGLGQYGNALLCVPLHGRAGGRISEVYHTEISEISSRLRNDGDPLAEQLAKAVPLCSAILAAELPEYRLMIEDFKFKARDSLTDSLYAAFLSLEPRPRVPIASLRRH
ncbi:uncharacterized protein B0I36DRAFT_350543 [Microdochium trichocladiopsis]|uniref:Uncharacterized protein n=1 Tax=Microdochium trichocladiopsis TaxID=1682393 RepID=A0A9P8Y4U7_9PEZI|nr:uncharacterized protein B0I36DRAFT_350543 [Microdochium trichocladiopsis]KAH7029716.1 hypothetical protein B0I36DRAFT_350543 [Microdochium trichocladiopsis]